MSLVTFHRIFYKNVFAVGNTGVEIRLDEYPTTLISGTNGSGKSTAVDMINFALFGAPYRKVNKGDIVNTINNKDAYVELDFTAYGKQYQIQRGMKPDVFKIIEDGEEIPMDANKKDYQKRLEQLILRMNQKTFQQTCLISASTYRPFMDLEPAKRREVIEDILDINVFGVMAKLNKEQRSKTVSKLEEVKKDKDLISKEIELTEKHLQEKDENREEQETAIKNKIRKKKLVIKQLDDELNDIVKKGEKFEYDALVKEKEALEEGLNSFKQQLSTSEHEIKQASKQNEFFEDNDTCPTCTQEIDGDFKSSILSENNQLIENKSVEKETLTKNIEKLKEDIDNIDEDIQQRNELRREYKQVHGQKKQAAEDLEELEDELEEFQNKAKDDSEEQEKHLKDLQKKEKANLKDYENLTEEKAYYDYANILLKDDGSKSRIIREYLPVINQTINQYLNQFALPVGFELDEEFNETVKARYRDKFSYNMFSEGQKKRIDLSILLAWREVAKLKNSINTNLLIFDETADTNLDSEAVDELMDILLSLNLNVFVISHKQDLFVDKMNNHIRFELDGNFTRVVEEV